MITSSINLLICLFIYRFSVGAGGGYCDRDNVEYIDRYDSDDEIDDVSIPIISLHYM